jgi:hypothetical protein
LLIEFELEVQERDDAVERLEALDAMAEAVGALVARSLASAEIVLNQAS